MTLELDRLGERFSRLRVLVIGDTMLDRYVFGSSRRLSQEGPVPVVDVERRSSFAGGAGNTAANVAALGASVELISVVGTDHVRTIRHLLGAVGTDHLIADSRRRTLVKERVVAGDQIVVRVDSGSTVPVSAAAATALERSLRKLTGDADLVIVSDYDYGVVTDRTLESLDRLATRPPLIVDSKKLTVYRSLRPWIAKPNHLQALQLLGMCHKEDLSLLSDLGETGQMLLERTGAEIAAVTLDSRGAVILEAGQAPHRTYATPSRSLKASGAGDTFTAAFALALAAGEDVPTAAEIATAASAVAVRSEGTASCSIAELRASLTGDKCLDQGSAARLAAMHRSAGRRVVFTNGCFDLLHRGHVAYLSQAKELGDVLMVGLNSDASVRSLKGPGRPVTPLSDRIKVLGGLSSVDHIIPFEELDPATLIRDIRPDLYVKGGDYSLHELPERQLVESFGGTVRILPYLSRYSTTELIRRISHVDGQSDDVLAGG